MVIHELILKFRILCSHDIYLLHTELNCECCLCGIYYVIVIIIVRGSEFMSYYVFYGNVMAQQKFEL